MANMRKFIENTKTCSHIDLNLFSELSSSKNNTNLGGFVSGVFQLDLRCQSSGGFGRLEVTLS